MYDPQKIRPPHVTLALIIVCAVLQFIISPQRVLPGWSIWPGVAFLVAGLAMLKSAHGTFVASGTPVAHHERSTTLVTEGLFRHSRNPMYIGGLMTFTGIALAAGTWVWFILPAGLALILNFIYIPWEERRMRELFGASYEEYCRSVPRWIG